MVFKNLKNHRYLSILYQSFHDSKFFEVFEISRTNGYQRDQTATNKTNLVWFTDFLKNIQFPVSKHLEIKESLVPVF
jgi:hypothetical protein